MLDDVILLEKLKIGFGYQTDAELAGFFGITPAAVCQIRSGQTKLGPFQRIKIIDRLGAIALRDAIVSVVSEPLGQKIMQLSHDAAQRYASTNKPDQSEQGNAPKVTARQVLAEIDPVNLGKKILQLDANQGSAGENKIDQELSVSGKQVDTAYPNEAAKFNEKPYDATLIDLFKERFNFRTDSDLGEYLGVKKSAISNVRKGASKLGELSRLRMLKKIDESFDLLTYEEGIKSSEFLGKLLDKVIEGKSK
jgi:transcriptional regulator with XRE-family HTH domain